MTVADDNPTEDRRRSLRSRCLLGARILYDDHIRTLDCRLLNISEGGALLRTEAVDILPATFTLAIDARGQRRRARVRWRAPGRFGVALEPRED